MADVVNATPSVLEYVGHHDVNPANLLLRRNEVAKGGRRK